MVGLELRKVRVQFFQKNQNFINFKIRSAHRHTPLHVHAPVALSAAQRDVANRSKAAGCTQKKSALGDVPVAAFDFEQL